MLVSDERFDPRRRARARWLGLLSALALVPGCTPEEDASGAIPVAEVPTFEEFEASVPRFEDSWTVEGDIAIHSEEELRAYYDRRIASSFGGVGTSEQALIADTGGINGNGINLVPVPRRYDMTYCVSDGFGASKAEVVARLNAAATSWEQTVFVNFIYKSSQDASCSASNNNVWFNVRLVSGTTFGARAFFPDDPRQKRELLIDVTEIPGLATGGLKHELGHMLGFEHEFNHDDSPLGCKEAGVNHQGVPYDSKSVMHYTKSDDSKCHGDNNTYTISRLDKIASQAYYGPPADRCSLIDRDNCFSRNGICEEAYSTQGARSDLCRWTSVTKSECEAPERRGLWTTEASGFDDLWPTALPDGASAACITQMNNLSCTTADEDRCALHGASCERAFNINGGRHDLCRWYDVKTAAECKSPGLWTTKQSGFAQQWPTAVGLWPTNKDGACITQVGNLPN